MNLIRPALAAALAAFASSAQAADPHPPQLTVSFLSEPAPIVQNGATKLAYEMLLTNFVGSPYQIASIEARAGDRRMAFDATALASMMMRFEDRGRTPPASDPLTLEGGRGAVVFFLIDLGAAKAPAAIAHRLSVIDDKGQRARGRAIAPLPVVAAKRPIVVAGAAARGHGSPGDFAEQRQGRRPSPGRCWSSTGDAFIWRSATPSTGCRYETDGRQDARPGRGRRTRTPATSATTSRSSASPTARWSTPADGLGRKTCRIRAQHAVPIGFDNAGGNHVVDRDRAASLRLLRPHAARARCG